MVYRDSCQAVHFSDGVVVVAPRVLLFVAAALFLLAVSCADRTVSASAAGRSRLYGVVVGEEPRAAEARGGDQARDELRGVVEERRKRRWLWFLLGAAAAAGAAVLVGTLTGGGDGAGVGPEHPPVPPEEFF